jgi:DMSO/TMAO reductase YedYZ molybdopterin-dependent catalytic subunit
MLAGSDGLGPAGLDRRRRPAKSTELGGLLPTQSARVQTLTLLSLDGDVTSPMNWSADDLKKLPRLSQKIKEVSEHGGHL